MDELHNDLELSSNEDINRKLRTYFDGKIVRKDLTKSIKEEQMSLFMFLNFCLDSIVARMIRQLLKMVWQM